LDDVLQGISNPATILAKRQAFLEQLGIVDARWLSRKTSEIRIDFLGWGRRRDSDGFELL
jgi:hypothetical protein